MGIVIKGRGGWGLGFGRQWQTSFYVNGTLLGYDRVGVKTADLIPGTVLYPKEDCHECMLPTPHKKKYFIRSRVMAVN